MSQQSPNKPNPATPDPEKTTATKAPGKITEPPEFERAVEELEHIVDRLEHDELSLEESLKVFERGIGLTRACQRALDEAEQRVRILTDASEDAEPEPFATRGGAAAYASAADNED